MLSVRYSLGGVHILFKGIVHGQSLGPLLNGQEEKAESEEKDKVNLGGGIQVQFVTHGILRRWKIVKGIIGCISNWHFKGAGKMTP